MKLGASAAAAAAPRRARIIVPREIRDPGLPQYVEIRMDLVELWKCRIHPACYLNPINIKQHDPPSLIAERASICPVICGCYRHHIVAYERCWTPELGMQFT